MEKIIWSALGFIPPFDINEALKSWEKERCARNILTMIENLKATIIKNNINEQLEKEKYGL